MTGTVSPRPDPLGGPVSVALEADLRRNVRANGLVVWLDSPNNYREFAERLAQVHTHGGVPYKVVVFRGSYLELMVALEDVGAGTQPAPAVIYAPEQDDDSIKNTPLCELFQAGKRYQKGMGTLVTEAAAGHVHPDRLAEFLRRKEWTLEQADTWLQASLAPQGSEANGGEWAMVRHLKPTGLLDDLWNGGFVTQHWGAQGLLEQVWERIGVCTGLMESWRRLTVPMVEPQPRDVAFVLVSWALGVEYVHDLKRPPVSEHLRPMKVLPPPVVQTNQEIAVYVRQHHAGFYQRTADETETWLADEVEAAVAVDLGKIDTFRFEEDKVLKAALESLGQKDYAQVMEWAEPRVGPNRQTESFWLREDPSRLSAWTLVYHAAALGLAIQRAGERLTVGAAFGVEAAVEVYVERGAAVDQAHRQLEQRRTALLYPPVPEFETLRVRLDGMRRVWSRWADTWATDFGWICRERGFLPPLALQQRMVFDEVVRPLAQRDGTTAYFVVDALRFEMGEELSRWFKDSKTTDISLKARLAELPTVTEVGMNVLAPVVQNRRLKPVMSKDESAVVGFQTGEFQVFDPKSRQRAMHDRVGGAVCPWWSVDEVMGKDSAELKRSVSQARLVVVCSQEIDAAGESGVGLAAFEPAMQKLRAAWRLLRDAGVRRFVVTSDHGFLLLDDTTGRVQPFGRKVDPKRRFVFSKAAVDGKDQTRVELADLEYEGVDGSVVFPATTAVFDTGRKPFGFVHGGNSLQERVIPVLTVFHRTASGGNLARYRVVAKAKDGVAGMHCVEGVVEMVSRTTLDFGSDKEVELLLRVPDGEGAGDVVVELCQTRGPAKIVGGLVTAVVGERFELFFRLSGSVETRVSVQLEAARVTADVEPGLLGERFAVAATGFVGAAGEPLPMVAVGTAWLEQLENEGVRRLFAHLAEFGVVTETEAAGFLGGARGVRIFSRQLEEWAKKAPFGVRVEVTLGEKRYVREGVE